MSTVQSSISPAAHRAAIDALEGQRAAYRQFARQAEAQQGLLSTGNVDPVAEFTESAARQVDALGHDTRSVRALVERTTRGASEAQLRDIERRMDEMTREARTAETAIHNLTSQLEAWRDAFGRQLTELGITPGEPSASRAGYGQPASSKPPARILDRKG